ncbi:DUF3817 domain-containing protein [Brachybacterium sp. DNPG3]
MSTAPADETLLPADATSTDAAPPAEAPAAGASTSDAGLSRIGRAFAIAAVLEAITWAGLLIGMLLKYGTGTTELGVVIFGRLHGGMFLIYVAVSLLTAWKQRWSWWVALLALAAAVPPLVTVPLEMWLRRSGRLGVRSAR